MWLVTGHTTLLDNVAPLPNRQQFKVLGVRRVERLLIFRVTLEGR